MQYTINPIQIYLIVSKATRTKKEFLNCFMPEAPFTFDPTFTYTFILHSSSQQINFYNILKYNTTII